MVSVGGMKGRGTAKKHKHVKLEMPLQIDALTMNKNFVRKPPNKLLSTKLPVCGAVEIYGL